MQFVADLEANEDGGAADHVRDRRAPRPDRVHARRPLRLCGRAAGTDRQRRLRPAPERRIRSGARLDPAPHATQRPAPAPAVADRRSPRRNARRRCGASRTRESGRRAARHSTTCPRSSCAGSRWTVRPSWPTTAATRSSTPAWGATAEEIKEDILEHGLKDDVLRQHYETEALDASTLLAAMFGFLPGDDERLHKSVLAIADDLTEDGFVLRYRTDETDDGLSGKEGSFLICSFWLVSALVDRRRGASGPSDLMERLLRVASPLGLYAEEFDTSTGRHLGNFPQAFSHLALIEAAARIVVAEVLEEFIVTDHYDVIVIGSGAGGGTLVRHLAPSGKRILLLERGDWLTREPQNWDVHDVFVDGRYISRGHVVRRRHGEGVPAAGPLLRRRRDQAVRRGALPPARGGLRRAPAPRRRLARVADRLRRDGAVLHAGGAGLPGARRARRGPDRAARERSLSVPRRLARAAHPAARGRPRRRRASPVPRSVRRDAERGGHAVQQMRAVRNVRRLPVPRACQVRRRGAGRAARPRALQRDAADERAGPRPADQPGRHGGDGGRGGTRGRQRDLCRRHRGGLVRRVAVGQAAAGLGQRQAPATASPTDPTSSGATTPSTTARRCWRCRRKRTRPSSRRRSG